MKICIIDDHPIVGSALESLIGKRIPQAKVQIINEDPGLSCFNLNIEADVFIIDLNFFGEIKGYQLIQKFRNQQPHSKIIILSMHNEGVYVDKGMSVGAQAYVVKSDPPEEILNAIESVNNGQKFLSSGVKNKRKPLDLEEAHISAREHEILLLVIEGLDSKQIADKLNISFRTVQSHRQNIMKKFKVTNTAQLVQTYLAGDNSIKILSPG